jgi:thiol-disulfide isomerase/thioredoxin
MTSPTPDGWRAKLAKLGRRGLVRMLRDGLLLLVFVLVVGAFQTRDLPSGKAPSFALEALGGQTVSHKELSGRPTLLVFWAPWCGVCRVESQNVSWVQRLVGAHANVLSVAVQYDRLQDVKAYVAAQDVDYPVLLGGRSAARRFGVTAYPTLFFLNAEGEIKRAAVGYTTTFGLLWRLLF